MADHDPLEASEWGDVLSANKGQYNDLDEDIVNELSSTFAHSLQNNADDDHDADDAQDKAEDADTHGANTGYSNDEDASSAAAAGTAADNESGLHQPKSPLEEQKDTTELFSALTEGAKDNGFKKEVLESPKREEALFNESTKRTSTILPDLDQEEEEVSTDTVKASLSLSPNRVRRQNVYKAPRFRRQPIKKDSVETKPSAKEESSDPLGPLGAAEEENPLEEETESPAEALLRQAEAPLFEINRTPLSPLPVSETHAEVETVEAAVSSLQKPAEQSIKLNITVGDPLKVGDLTSAHIVYSVRTLTDSDLLTNKETVVSRRYRDFRWLYRQLQHTHPGRIIPPPPDKQVVGRFNQDFVEGRRFALERMLVKISQNAHLQTDPDFIMFLQSERFSSEAREHEKALGASSTFTESDHNDGSLSNNSGGFLSSIGGAFSFTPKIVEPDDYFKDKKSYIEALDQEFRTFARNLETVVIQRQDLSTVTEEFANIISTIADLEVSKITTELFQEFSNTQMRIKDLLERLSLQDMLTIGATLDEYQRIVSSIRTVFEQRDKILIQLAKSESDLRKKQSSYDKAFKYNRTQTDKLDLLKSELVALESKNRTIREKFQSISTVIIEELKTFETDKIHDFRNSIEIFLESTIESQKEAVELWETFYNANLTTTESTPVEGSTVS
jgi:sorting nexin-1/2